MKKWYSFLPVFIFTILTACSPTGDGFSDKKNWVAKIEDEVITVEEFNKTFEILLKINYTEGQSALIKDDIEVKKQALDNLIAQKIILKELEKNNFIKEEFIKIFEMKALTQYFMQKRVLPKVDIPSDNWIQTKYQEVKKELEKKGITDFAQAKKIIAAEYQRAKYMTIMADEMKKLKMKTRIFMNDEFEQDGIKKYIEDTLKPEDYAKTWLFKIENQTYYASDMEKFMRIMAEISYGDEGVKRYDTDKNLRKNTRMQLFQEYMGALLVIREANEEGWLNDSYVKDFIQIYVNNAKSEFFIRKQIGDKLTLPTEKEIKEYYEKNKKEINQPYEKVKDMIAQQLFSEQGKMKTFAYIEKLKSARKILINDTLFEGKKEDEKKEETKTPK